jgi:hypothetical protein
MIGVFLLLFPEEAYDASPCLAFVDDNKFPTSPHSRRCLQRLLTSWESHRPVAYFLKRKVRRPISVGLACEDLFLGHPAHTVMHCRMLA